MHRLPETYLKEVAAQLQSMPAKERAEELREMRIHLENALASGRERGLSEEAAACEALQQFGLPETVGRDVMMAWRRGNQSRIYKLLRLFSFGLIIFGFFAIHGQPFIGGLVWLACEIAGLLARRDWKRRWDKHLPCWCVRYRRPLGIVGDLGFVGFAIAFSADVLHGGWSENAVQVPYVTWSVIAVILVVHRQYELKASALTRHEERSRYC